MAVHSSHYGKIFLQLEIDKLFLSKHFQEASSLQIFWAGQAKR